MKNHELNLNEQLFFDDLLEGIKKSINEIGLYFHEKHPHVSNSMKINIQIGVIANLFESMLNVTSELTKKSKKSILDFYVKRWMEDSE